MPDRIHDPANDRGACTPSGRCWCGVVHPAGWHHASGAGSAYPARPIDGTARDDSPDPAAFEYASEEVGEAFTEWCASEGIEARDDQEYRTIRAAFTAGMNEAGRYGDG
jgi:hypothetical protein